MGKQAAQNQHYVPKLFLRSFLSNEDKEQVTVFSKRSEKTFTTSIKNIMAERRFHDFNIDESYVASFEGAMGKLEEVILPSYRAVIDERRLSKTAEEIEALAIFVAFQYLRTRAQRDKFLDFEKMIENLVVGSGGTMEDVANYVPMTEDRLKRQHFDFIKDALPKLAAIAAKKVFLLIEARADEPFYLSDHPVVLNNTLAADSPYGGLGFGVTGIEIYLPLSPTLTLAAWCPSIFARLDREVKSARQSLAALTLSPRVRSRASENQSEMAKLRGLLKKQAADHDAIVDGRPLPASKENVQFQNSLQMSFAKEFVISNIGDFEFARRFMKDHPGHSGLKFQVS